MTTMEKQVFLFVLLSFHSHTIVKAGSGRHSLYVLATYMTGETPFPAFTAVVMLDDVQVGYFDSEIDKIVHSRHDTERKEMHITPAGVNVLRSMHFRMREILYEIKHRFNLTKGIQVQQRITGCEMLPNGEAALMMVQDSCNAINADGFYYNMKKSTYLAENPWKIQWDETWRPIHTMRYTHIYLPVCIRELRNLLEAHKSVVLRRVRPRVRFLQKTVPGGAKVSCLATDFYPRHINLTLLKDGQPVAEQDLTGGTVLPNGNGLYQVRKTLEITTQELRERHSYTCTASHLSLDNKLDISWQPEFSREHRVPVLGSVAVLALVVIVLLMCARKMRKVTDSRTTLQQPANIDAQGTQQLNPPSHPDT